MVDFSQLKQLLQGTKESTTNIDYATIVYLSTRMIVLIKSFAAEAAPTIPPHHRWL
jgi:hypothetical protein